MQKQGSPSRTEDDEITIFDTQTQQSDAQLQSIPPLHPPSEETAQLTKLNVLIETPLAPTDQAQVQPNGETLPVTKRKLRKKQQPSKNLSLTVKLEVISNVDARDETQAQCARRLGVSRQSISQIMKNRHVYLEASERGTNKKFGKVRNVAYPELEKKILAWAAMTGRAPLPNDISAADVAVLVPGTKRGLDSIDGVDADAGSGISVTDSGAAGADAISAGTAADEGRPQPANSCDTSGCGARVTAGATVDNADVVVTDAAVCVTDHDAVAVASGDFGVPTVSTGTSTATSVVVGRGGTERSLKENATVICTMAFLTSETGIKASDVRQFAEAEARKMGIDDASFTASNGWWNRFQNRYTWAAQHTRKRKELQERADTTAKNTELTNDASADVADNDEDSSEHIDNSDSSVAAGAMTEAAKLKAAKLKTATLNTAAVASSSRETPLKKKPRRRVTAAVATDVATSDS